MTPDAPVVPRLSRSVFNTLTGMTKSLAEVCVEKGLIELVEDKSEAKP
jgi:hypothetical protein